MVLSLKDKPLRATACGGCRGSHSDANVRMDDTEDEPTAPTEKLAVTSA